MRDEGCKPLKKAVFPVAGLGTRFLPATKEIPKEMLPLLDRPLIHHGVDEAVASGCTEVIMITGTGKDSIVSYFEPSVKLEERLQSEGKADLANIIHNIPHLAKFSFACQEEPLGLGHAVMCAEEMCEGEPFALLLPDDVMVAEPTVLRQLESVRKKYGGSVLCLEEVLPEETKRYGVVDAEEIERGIFKINSLVEKPNMGDAPSNLAIIGRYVLSPSIFKHLHKIERGSGGEYQLTDAINLLLEDEPVYGCLYSGQRHDCGVMGGWIRATVAKALEVPELRQIICETLKKEKIIIN